MLRSFSQAQLVNVLLRLLPLVAKLVLTLYMGRYFSLAEMGVYGLVVGAVIFLTTFVGQGFNYIVARDVVHVKPLTALHKMRDQLLFYGFNYMALIVCACAFLWIGFGRVPPKVYSFIVVLTILESIASNANYNMNSLNQQLMTNATIFVRTGLWVVPVVLLGIQNPLWRTVDVVLQAWMGGALVSLVVTLWCWRGMPWREVFSVPVDWHWLKQGLKKSSLIWLGSLGLSGGTYIDRFVVEHYLRLEDVGVVTYYFSFASALLTLMQSGVLAFAYPRLIAMHRDGHTVKFMHEARLAFWQVSLGAGLMAVTLAVIVPVLGIYTQRPELTNSSVTLWLMLFGTWIKANAETLNYVLYARHQDRAIWLGNLLFLVPAIGGNALLVPLMGLPGIGVASVIAALFLLLWRWRHAGEVMGKA